MPGRIRFDFLYFLRAFNRLAGSSPSARAAFSPHGAAATEEGEEEIVDPPGASSVMITYVYGYECCARDSNHMA